MKIVHMCDKLNFVDSYKKLKKPNIYIVNKYIPINNYN